MKIQNKFSLLVMILVLLVPVTLYSGTVDRHQNSLGAVISDYNPWVYDLGALRTGSVFYCDQRKEEACTSIVFSPFGVDTLSTEQLLFCGDQSDEFKNKKAPIVLVYRRQGSRVYDGIACHNLLKVFEVSFPKE